MTVLEQRPLTLPVPLRQEPGGVLRVGESRVLLELVIRAYQRGASPQEIVRMYDSLALRDVFAVIAYYLAHPTEIDEYLADATSKRKPCVARSRRRSRVAPIRRNCSPAPRRKASTC